jgi:hypothetical protein
VVFQAPPGHANTIKLYTYPVLAPALTTPTSCIPKRQHLSRLLKIWRSDGWPSKDALEIELLVAGWAQIVTEAGHEKLRVSESGLAHIAASRQRNKRALSTHDRLAERVAGHLHDAGRVVWRELSLRAKVGPESEVKRPLQALDLFSQAMEDNTVTSCKPSVISKPLDSTDTFEPIVGSWRMARPDVFSVRNTSVEAYLHPVVHEIKVSRADLFSDLRHAAKRASYQWLCCECHYVFPMGMAQPDELPLELGVWVIHGDIDTGRLQQLRPARHSSCTLPFPVWLSLAKATTWQPERDARQVHLGQPEGPLPGAPDSGVTSASMGVGDFDGQPD